MLPDEDCDDGGVPGDADNADYGDVHSEGVNEPVRDRLDDVTVAQPMIVQIRSAVSVAFIPRDRIGWYDWLVAGDVRDVDESWRHHRMVSFVTFQKIHVNSFT